MGYMSPGDTSLLADAYQVSGLGSGSKILDIACGEGDTLEFLRENFGARPYGIDRSAELISRGKSKYKKLKLKVGEEIFLDFPSLSFDAVITECALSLSAMQLEAIHEAYCVLKPGGKYIVADLCEREQARMGMDARVPVETQGAKPRIEEPVQEISEGKRVCGEVPQPSINSRDGVVDLYKFRESCTQIGFRLLHYEDRTKDLDEFAAKIILEYGSYEGYINSITPTDGTTTSICKAPKDGRLGYFLIIMEKPKEGKR